MPTVHSPVATPPFSHVLEDCFEQHSELLLSAGSEESLRIYREDIRPPKRAQFHEWAGREILEQILRDSTIAGDLPNQIIWEIFTSRRGTGWASAIHDLIDEQIDVDRLDYICRDAKRAGTDYHAIDIERLLSSLELHEIPSGDETSSKWKVGVGQTGISAVEALLMQRDQSYRWMIFHSKAIIADTALKRSFNHALDLAQRSEAPMPALDYVSRWWRQGERTPGPSYRVDDHLVTEWLRDVREAYLARSRRSKTARMYLSWMDIWDTFSSAPMATWRNYGEFLTAVDEGQELIRPFIGSFIGLMARQSGRDEGIGTRVVNGLAFMEEEGNPQELAAAVEDMRVPELASMLTLSFTKLLADVPSSDEMLEEIFNRRLRPLAGVTGHWIVAHRLKFDAIKQLEDEEFRLWSGAAQEAFSELSPIYNGLLRSNELRPMLWGFFVPLDGGYAPDRKVVRLEFIRKLIQQLTQKCEEDYNAR